MSFRSEKAGMSNKPPMPDEPVLTIDLTDEMSDDWLRARRLKKKSDKGDKAAQEELDRMESSKLTKLDQ